MTYSRFKRTKKTIIKFSKDKQEILLFKKLLFQVYCLDLKWHDPKDFPEKIFTDKYDSLSDFILIYHNDKLIGGMRIVKQSRYDFPHEKILNTKLPLLPYYVDKKIQRKMSNIERYEIAEITRVFSISGGKFFVGRDFAKSLYWYGVCNSIKVYYMVIDLNLFLLSHRFSVPIIPIGVPVFCEGSWTIPSLLFTSDIKNNLLKFNLSFWYYISDKSNILGFC